MASLIEQLLQLDPANAAKYRKMTAAKRQVALSKLPAYQANQQALGALQPEIDLLNAERERQSGLYQQMADIQKGFISALLSHPAFSGAGQNVSNFYQGAADSTAAYGKGLSEAEGQIQSGIRDDLTNYLSNIVGAPQAAIDQAAAGAGGQDLQDVVYGLGGMIPAEGLAREGAAFASAAESYKPYVGHLGLQGMNQLRADALRTDQDIASQIASVAGKSPGLALEILQQMRENRRADEAMEITKKQLGLSTRKQGFDEWWTQEEARIDAEEKGKRLDVSASRARGHAVYRDGSEDPSIKIKGYGSSESEDKGPTTYQKNTRKSQASKVVSDLAEEAMGELPKPDDLGYYPAPNGKRTKDPNKAVRIGGLTYEQVLQRALARVAPMLGWMTGKQRRQFINDILRGYGIRPPAPSRLPSPRG